MPDDLKRCEKCGGTHLYAGVTWIECCGCGHRVDVPEREAVWNRRAPAERPQARGDDRIVVLENALRRARSDMADWCAYVDDYYKKKHNLAGDMLAIDDALAGRSQAPSPAERGTQGDVEVRRDIAELVRVAGNMLSRLEMAEGDTTLVLEAREALAAVEQLGATPHRWIGDTSSSAYCARCGKDYRDRPELCVVPSAAPPAGRDAAHVDHSLIRRIIEDLCDDGRTCLCCGASLSVCRSALMQATDDPCDVRMLIEQLALSSESLDVNPMETK